MLTIPLKARRRVSYSIDLRGISRRRKIGKERRKERGKEIGKEGRFLLKMWNLPRLRRITCLRRTSVNIYQGDLLSILSKTTKRNVFH
jgi:hypothetical protein